MLPELRMLPGLRRQLELRSCEHMLVLWRSLEISRLVPELRMWPERRQLMRQWRIIKVELPETDEVFESGEKDVVWRYFEEVVGVR